MAGLKERFEQTNESTTVSTSYLMNENGLIQVSVIIGDVGQAAMSEIWLDDQVQEDGIQGSFKFTRDSIELNARTLNIYTIVTDTSRATNYTEVSIHIRGGASDFNHRLHKEVAREGESIFYETEIFFFQ